MKREHAGPIHTTVFVDYDNIYLSLKRKNEDAAKRFAKDSGAWLQAIVSGELITPTSIYSPPVERRLAMTRCYGNSTPRRNAHDNSTDMNSFPFVKHHFLRSGFEIVDCPPMTSQLKNAADIRMVLEIGDILSHSTFFDEVVILSGDADFTPLLHRLRAHARRSVVFANDNTAQPYTAISDGEIRESNLIALLVGDRSLSAPQTREIAPPQLSAIDIDAARISIIAEVVNFVRSAPQAVPLETLADRAVRIVGRDKTIGTDWGGYGSFHKLLLSALPGDVHLSDTPPYTVFDENRHITETGLLAPQTSAAPAETRAPRAPVNPAERNYREAPPQLSHQAPPADHTRSAHAAPPYAAQDPAPAQQSRQSSYDAGFAQPAQRAQPAPPPPVQPTQTYSEPPMRRETALAPQPPQQARGADQATQIQQSISRIHTACQAPALAPAEYRVLFDVMAREITSNGLQGSQTLVNLTQRAREFGLDLKRDDLRFILDVVSESDPWFEQGASASLFASRFRNFVVARCRSQGLSLSSDELDLVEAWFSAQPPQQRAPAYGRTAPPPPAAQQPAPAAPPPAQDRWWTMEPNAAQISDQRAGLPGPEGSLDDEFPRIVRSRLRG
jgi:hypothetical protein